MEYAAVFSLSSALFLCRGAKPDGLPSRSSPSSALFLRVKDDGLPSRSSPSSVLILAQASEGWWTAGGSNSRPPRCERGALPTELAAHSVGSLILRMRPPARAIAAIRAATSHPSLPPSVEQILVLLLLELVDQLDVLVGDLLRLVEPLPLVVFGDRACP